MSAVLRALLVVVAASVVASEALALPADPRVDPTVDAVPLQVTLSRSKGKANLSLDTLAAYRLDLTNETTNQLNRIFLNGTATTDGGTKAVEWDSVIIVKDSSIPGEGCAVVPETTNSVQCDLGSLDPGDSLKIFIVYKAPTASDDKKITFNWTAGGFEGNGEGNGCCAKTDFAETTLIDPDTNPSYQSNAQTFVKSGGGTVFTGDEAIATSKDGWSTKVVFNPWTSTSKYTVATISESPKTSCRGNGAAIAKAYGTASGCFQTKLTAKLLDGGTFDGLLITIDWDKSLFSLGKFDPAGLEIYYNPNDTGDTGWKGPLVLCSSTTPNGPSPGVPCLVKPPFKVTGQQAATNDSIGDIRFEIKAADNGRYEQ